MTTQDILFLTTTFNKGADFYRGDIDFWLSKDELNEVFHSLRDEANCIDFISQGEKVKPVVLAFREALREFLDCTADDTGDDYPHRWRLTENAKDRTKKWFDPNPKIIELFGNPPEVVHPSLISVGSILSFCEAWLHWIDTYFPIDPNGQQQPGQETALAASAGRPSHKDKTVKDCMLLQDDEQKNELLKKLHELIDGKKGRRVALVILVCEAMGLMTNPGHAVMMKEFGYIGARSGYNRFHDMGIKNYKKEEADGIMVHLAGFRDSLK